MSAITTATHPPPSRRDPAAPKEIRPPRNDYREAIARIAFAACSTIVTTARGCDTYTAWLALTSTTVEPARLDIARWASGGIIRSSVVSKYQMGFVRHAG